jgi:hypothetical protein
MDEVFGLATWTIYLEIYYTIGICFGLIIDWHGIFISGMRYHLHWYGN